MRTVNQVGGDEVTSGRLSTGDNTLDRHFETGLRTGSLLAIRAPPGCQSEALLYTLMQERPTLYVSTMRREDAVRRDLERVTGPRTEFDVASVAEELNMASEMAKKISSGPSLSSDYTDQGTMLDDAFELVHSVDGQANVIFDPVTPLERSDEDTMYQTVLNELKERVVEMDGLGVLHCVDHDEAPMLRERTLTTADVVWTLEPTVQSKTQKYYLTVSKNRGEPEVNERIELTLDRRVEIDHTRHI